MLTKQILWTINEIVNPQETVIGKIDFMDHPYQVSASSHVFQERSGENNIRISLTNNRILGVVSKAMNQVKLQMDSKFLKALRKQHKKIEEYQEELANTAIATANTVQKESYDNFYNYRIGVVYKIRSLNEVSLKLSEQEQEKYKKTLADRYNYFSIQIGFRNKDIGQYISQDDVDEFKQTKNQIVARVDDQNESFYGIDRILIVTSIAHGRSKKEYGGVNRTYSDTRDRILVVVDN